MKENRLIFAQNHQNWSSDDWKQVLWSDESPFEYFHSPNRQNDRVWATGSKNIEPIQQVKIFGESYALGDDVAQSSVRSTHRAPTKVCKRSLLQGRNFG